MIVGFYQFKPQFGAVKENLDKIEDALMSNHFDLVVLPELCTSGYQFVSQQEVKELAETVPDGPGTQRLLQIARRKNAYIAAGLAEEAEGKYYNSALLAGPNGLVTKYRKLHLFHEETIWFTQGNELPEIVDINGAKVGMIICFDWIFPELIRSLALSGADLVLHPSNLVMPYCQSAMRTRSIENTIFTITANRTGTEERGEKNRLTFTGKSQVTGVRGSVLAEASEADEVFHVVNIDPEEARNKSFTEYNSLFENRRPEVYSDVLTNEKVSGD